MEEQTAAVPETPELFTPTEAPEAAPSEEQQIADLRAAYAKSQGDDEPAEEAPAPEPEKEGDAEKDEEAPLATIVAPPSHLPEDIQALWKDIPEAARPALERSYRSLGDRLAQQGRVVAAVKPTYDVLVQAAQEMPEIATMTPNQIAESVFVLARGEVAFVKDPVGTLIGLAEKRGVTEALRAALGGQSAPQPQFNPQQLLGTVQQQIPQMVQQQVEQAMQQSTLMQEITAFSRDPAYPLWTEVESDIPTYLPKAIQKVGEGASIQDKLAKAYDMAIHADPDLRAKVASASKKEPEPDPQKAAEAARAASINVSSRGASKPAVLSERQQLEQAWREAQRR